ncbi:MAG TPA: ATP synthase F1 subunit delta [Kiritimatiellia bacterium]|nr:ATP synthase F1 subunit delta [Kiritimatiellia bacterium]
MAKIIAARRYAKALYALSREQSAVEAVRQDLDALVNMMDASEDWKNFILNPVGSHTVRANIINQLLNGKVHDITLRFLRFIDLRLRINLLPEIRDAWMALYDENNGILRGLVISAVELDADQVNRLAARIAGRYGKKVELNTGVDASMIGGLKVFIGDEVHDFSISSQLEQLKKRMIYA